MSEEVNVVVLHRQLKARFSFECKNCFNNAMTPEPYWTQRPCQAPDICVTHNPEAQHDI